MVLLITEKLSATNLINGCRCRHFIYHAPFAHDPAFVRLGAVWDINLLHRVGFVHLDKSSLSLPQ